MANRTLSCPHHQALSWLAPKSHAWIALPRGLPVVPWSVAPALIPRCASPRCVSPPGTTLISIYLNWSFGTIFPQLDLWHKPQMAQLVFNSSQIVPFFSSPRGAIFWVFWFLSWAIYFGIGVSFIADLSSLRKSNKGSGTPRLIKCFLMGHPSIFMGMSHCHVWLTICNWIVTPIELVCDLIIVAFWS